MTEEERKLFNESWISWQSEDHFRLGFSPLAILQDRRQIQLNATYQFKPRQLVNCDLGLRLAGERDVNYFGQFLRGTYGYVFHRESLFELIFNAGFLYYHRDSDHSLYVTRFGGAFSQEIVHGLHIHRFSFPAYVSMNIYFVERVAMKFEMGYVIGSLEFSSLQQNPIPQDAAYIRDPNDELWRDDRFLRDHPYLNFIVSYRF